MTTNRFKCAAIALAAAFVFGAGCADADTARMAGQPQPMCFGPPPPPANLVGWWTLDATSGSSAHDNAAGNDGTVTFGAAGNSQAFVSGAQSGALRFRYPDQSNDAAQFVTIPSQPWLNFGHTTNFTIDGWMKLENLSGEGIATDDPSIVVSKGGNTGYTVLLNIDNTLSVRLYDTSRGLTVTTTAPFIAAGDVGNWVFLAVVVDRNSGITIYKNGAAVGTTAQPANLPNSPKTNLIDLGTNPAPLQIGGVAYNLLALSFDEVEVFDRALPAASLTQIRVQHKCKGSLLVNPNPMPPCVPPPPDMTAWYPFDSTPGERVLGKVEQLFGVANYAQGMVSGGLGFGTGYAQVVGSPVLDEGLGDFSIDGWVYVPGTMFPTSNYVSTLIDKRSGWLNSLTGYAVFLYNHHLGVQLANGSYSNYIESSANMVAGWNHFAVTVDRDATQGLILYVNGHVAGTFNPTAHQGDLDNPANLAFGRDLIAGSNNSHGAMLDEVEFFDRPLAAIEVQTISDAGGSGKCKV